MLCVIFNSAAPAGAAPLMAARRGCAAQEEKRNPTRTTARNPNVRSFTVGIFDNSHKKHIARRCSVKERASDSKSVALTINLPIQPLLLS